MEGCIPLSTSQIGHFQTLSWCSSFYDDFLLWIFSLKNVIKLTTVGCHNVLVFLCMSQVCNMMLCDFGLVITTCDMTPWIGCHKCVLHGYNSPLILSVVLLSASHPFKLDSGLLVTKTVPDITNSYSHGDWYKPCWWLWQCHLRFKWNFIYIAYLAKGQNARWQLFSPFGEHLQINPCTMGKPWYSLMPTDQFTIWQELVPLVN